MAGRVQAIFGHIRNGDVEAAPCSGLQADTAPADFQYTQPTGLLTQEQREFYEHNGYLVVKNVVPKDRLAVYREYFGKVCDGDIVIPGATLMKDITIAKSHAGVKGQRVVTKIQNFQDDKTLFEYCKLPEVTKYVQSFIGPDCMSITTMLINKPPDPGTKSSRHPMHQDLYYFPFRPANRIVCAWTAMQKVYRENGCLVCVPGTHKGELLDHAYPEWEGGVNKAYHGVKAYNPSMSRTWLEMDEGDTVFFHPLLLHGSGTNRTEGFRMSITGHYAASSCDYIDIKGTLQEAVGDEFLEILAKKIGKEQAAQYDWKDLWKLRARLVCGEIGTM